MLLAGSAEEAQILKGLLSVLRKRGIVYELRKRNLSCRDRISQQREMSSAANGMLVRRLVRE
jgi:hypothetical protein